MKKSMLSILIVSAVLTSGCEKTFDNYEPKDVPYFEPLAAPAAGSGYQIHVPAFPIQSNFEREIFVKKALGNTEEVYITGFEMKARPGTHHMIVYDYLTNDTQHPLDVLFDQNLPNSTGSYRSYSNSAPMLQAPSASYTFALPEGYAFKAKPNTEYNINLHYFNKTDKTRFGEMYLNFFTKPKNTVGQILEVEYLSNDVFEIGPNETKIVTTDFIMDKKTVFPMILSHYHKRGKNFEVRIKGGSRDGQVIYESQDYELPVVKTFATPLVLEKGEGLTTVVKYVNESDRIIRIGVTSDDEMNILIAFKYNP
jgi:hypothetical protein